MDALKFIKEMKKPVVITTQHLSAEEFFETNEGKKMLEIISKEVKVVDEKSFQIVDWGVIEKFEKNPLYRGRKFFVDMRNLGFDYTIISYHQDEAPVRTFLFEVK